MLRAIMSRPGRQGGGSETVTNGLSFTELEMHSFTDRSTHVSRRRITLYEGAMLIGRTTVARKRGLGEKREPTADIRAFP